jgi:hypothetical protein
LISSAENRFCPVLKQRGENHQDSDKETAALGARQVAAITSSMRGDCSVDHAAASDDGLHGLLRRALRGLVSD